MYKKEGCQWLLITSEDALSKLQQEFDELSSVKYDFSEYPLVLMIFGTDTEGIIVMPTALIKEIYTSIIAEEKKVVLN